MTPSIPPSTVKNPFSFDHQVAKIEDKEILTIFLKNTGEFPSYSLTFRGIDVDVYGFEEIQDIGDILKTPSPIYEKYWNDLTSGAISQALSLSLVSEKTEYTFKVFLNSRKGRSSFKIIFRKDMTGNWVRTVQALDHNEY